MTDRPAATTAPELRRVIGLPLLVLYGLGITIGAGIYVLIGSAAEQAGLFAPTAFLAAAFVTAFSALSFAEFSGRIPQAAGEAAYVEAGLNRNWLTLATGFMIVFSATIAGAAISLGCAGYVAVLVPLPEWVIVIIIVLAITRIPGEHTPFHEACRGAATARCGFAGGFAAIWGRRRQRLTAAAS